MTGTIPFMPSFKVLSQIDLDSVSSTSCVLCSLFLSLFSLKVPKIEIPFLTENDPNDPVIFYNHYSFNLKCIVEEESGKRDKGKALCIIDGSFKNSRTRLLQTRNQYFVEKRTVRFSTRRKLDLRNTKKIEKHYVKNGRRNEQPTQEKKNP